MRIAVIGGGAAGFFSAISAKESHPQAEVIIYEKSRKLLSKVKISGGGRCNVTNNCQSISELHKAYPRGGKQLKKAFSRFNNRHTIEWFETRGVPLYAQEDDRVFPRSDDSQSIVDCLLSQTRRLGIQIELDSPIEYLMKEDDHFILHFSASRGADKFDKVIVATGGSPKLKGFEWLEKLGHSIKEPIPSLFTFNMPKEPIKDLMGLVVDKTIVSIQGSKLKSDGPLLITHWGMSGPAILKLSAFGARQLHEWNYDFKVQVNWTNEINQHNVLQQLLSLQEMHPRKMLSSLRPYALPERLWLYLLNKCGFPNEMKWMDLGSKSFNKLVSVLHRDIYKVLGKTTFKEEFVTCGGVDLADVNMNSMQSKVCENLYFAGEVLDIDAITGGYNFQAAWTTGYIAGKLE